MELRTTIHHLIRQRHSPRIFQAKDISHTDMELLLDSARWAASAFNEQPWRFLICRQTEPDRFRSLLSCLVDANQRWAVTAPILMIALVRPHFTHNNKPNPHAWHDLGLAMGTLSLQATALGISLHQMAGFKAELIHANFPETQDYIPVTVSVLGYEGRVEDLPPDLTEQEQQKQRSRNPLEDMILQGKN